MTHRTAFACALASALTLSCGSGQQQTEQAPHNADASAGPVATNGPVVLGLPIGGSIDASERQVTLEGEPPDVQRGTASAHLASAPIELDVTVYGGRLASVSFSVEGENISVETYRQALAELEESLGAGASTRCVSEDDIPFERYLEQGLGLLETRWQTESFWARLTLQSSVGTPSFRLFGTVGSFDVPLPCEGDMLCSAGPQPAPPRAAKESAPPGCTIDLSSFPEAAIGGVAFGAPPFEAEAVLGIVLDEQTSWLHEAEVQVAGKPARLILAFYDGCLASYRVIIEGRGATEATYRHLQSWATPQLGEAVSTRCESEDGQPLAEHIQSGWGRLEARWPSNETVQSSLRLGGDRPLGEPPQIVFEASYVPLRPHAPQIDF